jgi:hypothetical protein
MDSSNTNNAIHDGKAHVERRPNPPEVSLGSHIESRSLHKSNLRLVSYGIPIPKERTSVDYQQRLKGRPRTIQDICRLAQ